MNSADWNAVVNGAIAREDAVLATVAQTQAVMSAFLVQLTGGSNPDVIVARARATAHLERANTRAALIEARRAAFAARLHSALSDEQRAIVDDMLANRSTDVVRRLAGSLLDIEALETRVQTAIQSVDNPEAVTSLARDAAYTLAMDLTESGV